MNTRRIAIAFWIIMAFTVGYALGTNLVVMRSAKKAFADVADSQYFASLVSVTTLDRLESGKVDDAKRLLAINISGYYTSRMPDVDQLRKAQLCEKARKLSERSPVLKEMLAKSSP
jgi:hypothetical protein